MLEPSEGQQIPNQDHPGETGEPTGGIPTTAGAQGNRPADGAPVLRPDEMNADGWEATGDGEDFLGLGDSAGDFSEATESPEVAQAAVEGPAAETTSALADAPEQEDGAFESWLEDEDEDSASWLMELEDEPGEDVFDPERLEAEFGLETESVTSSGGSWVLRLTLVAAGLGVGVFGARWYGTQHAGNGADTNVAHVETTNVAHVETTNVAHVETTPTQPTGGNANATNNANATTATSGGATQTNTGGGSAQATTETQGTGTANTGGDPATSGTATGTQTTTVTDPQPIVLPEGGGTGANNTEPTPEPEPTSGSTEGHQFTMPVEDMVVLPRVESSLRYASAEDLASIWQGTEIPLGKIEGERRVLTPAVGRVRLVIHSGEVFEGRLYAVGENKVWLDTGLGKMALLGWQIDHMEHIAPGDGPALGMKGSQDFAGLERVRVRTPGGVFYGKLLDRTDGTVTLITEEGGRIRLSNARVEPAGKSRTRIVDPGSAAPKEAASKRD